LKPFKKNVCHLQNAKRAQSPFQKSQAKVEYVSLTWLMIRKKGRKKNEEEEVLYALEKQFSFYEKKKFLGRWL